MPRSENHDSDSGGRDERDRHRRRLRRDRDQIRHRPHEEQHDAKKPRLDRTDRKDERRAGDRVEAVPRKEQERRANRKDEQRAGDLEAASSLPSSGAHHSNATPIRPSKFSFPSSGAHISNARPMKPTKFLLLHNIFDKSTERDKEFYLSIREEVHAKCSKEGSVVHAIHVDKHACCLCLKCDSVRSALEANRIFDGNLFEGRMIRCSFLDDTGYVRRFGS